MKDVATHTERVLSLYSGGGGLDIGFRMAIPNARTVCYVEREISSVAVLVKAIKNKYLDDAPIWSDSSTFDSAAWVGKVDWIIGGFPCQPWSVAGRRDGKQDERWLWDDISKFIRTLRPKGIFLENVSGLITGHGIDTILGSLSEMGYDARWASIKAANVGATHRRERVFILGYTKGVRFSKAEGIDEWRKRQSYIRNEVWNISRTTSNTELGNTTSKGSQRRDHKGNIDEKRWETQERQGRSTRENSIGLYPPSPDSEQWADIIREYPRLSPALEKSAFESDVRGMANGMATRLHRIDRLRILGNGVVPLQAAYALKTLIKTIEKEK